ncbi:ABC-type glycerol-3-phosphate transport system, substrate-binding protein [Paenibacillus sp. yr247]|uniref:extracellular solute-binding protein n=1 Tax=Paenibacillus sp. yr247 TaxID=1761880 RepID=UPI00088B763A|nr:extracellular solute-binding protein [Paenibacillus sp. yr247]SDO37648.1 ABC-type glycerol-3-phosphate transport system, substrate-binding protein [Paenibacillus sp. yr247]
MKKLSRNTRFILFPILMASFTLLSACSSSSSDTKGAVGTNASTTSTPIDITILMQDGANEYAQGVKEDDMYTKEMSRLFSNYSGRPYNIKFEILGHDDYFKQLTVRFASGDLPDAIWTDNISNGAHPTAVENGVFLELGPLIDKFAPNLKKDISEVTWNDPKVNANGKIYGIPKKTAAKNILVDLYRKDWLQKLGMKEPQTMDDYLAYFEAVKTHDLNGNGKNDEIPYLMRENLDFSYSFFGYFNAFPSIWQYKDGQLIPNLIAPEMKDAIKFYKMLYDKGYINKDLFTLKNNDWVTQIHQGKAGMWSHQSVDLMNGDNHDAYTDPNADIAALPGVKNAQGKANLVPESTGISAVYAITNKSKYPEDVIKFFDWVHSSDPEKNKFFAFGIKDQNFTETNGKINFDPETAVNKAKNVTTFFRVMINPEGDARISPLLINTSKYAASVNQATEYAKINTIKHEDINMPILLTMKTHPELGWQAGSLYLDMFAKVVTGREPLDTAFANFVTDWKKHGGDQAIKESTAWYKQFYKK